MVKIHGRYCGPNWTAGKKLAAEDAKRSDFDVKPIDVLDNACRTHDFLIWRDGPSYASDTRLMRAAAKIAIDSKQPAAIRAKATLIADTFSIVRFTRVK